MESLLNEEMVQSKTVLEVIAVAAEFCRFIDKIDNQEQTEVFGFLQKILTALYLKGSLLSAIEVDDEEANERFVTEEEYETLRYQLSRYFDSKDYFTAVDFVSGNTESMPVSLSELLCDIYLDLKDFLILYSKESLAAKENAVANCYYYFQTNWGLKLTMALPYIHYILSQQVVQNDEY